MTQRVVGQAEHYGAAVKLFKARILELDTTYEAIDEACLAADRWSNNILAPLAKKKMSIYNFFVLAAELGMVVQFVETAESRDKALQRLTRRELSPRVPANSKHQPYRVTIGPDQAHLMRINGGLARARKLSKRRRFRIARKAARARWARTADPSAIGAKR